MVEDQGPVNDTPREVPKIVLCPHCGFDNLPNSNYCGRCGLSIFDSEPLEEEHPELGLQPARRLRICNLSGNDV